MAEETNPNVPGTRGLLLELARAGEREAFVLSAGGRCPAFWVSPEDLVGVQRAARDLAADVERVSGARPDVQSATGGKAPARATVWIGTIGRHAGIDELVRGGKLDVGAVRGRRECWLVEVVGSVDGGGEAEESLLVIAGSDKRGTIYGIYEVSELIGVSPWYYWADVPVPRMSRIALGPGRRVGREPAVRYRGIFLNDEEPALAGWARDTFGGFKREFYGRVFELLLRLRANFLWPAMWGSAFNEDDDNAALADLYGVVMGTSHHEPMLRSQKEWKQNGEGPWHYGLNAERLRAFWRFGIERNRRFESVITLGMRGDGDMPMSASEDVALLERVIADQSEILREVHGSDLRDVPRVIALYKEVQSYFEQGLALPDDVTLIFCDDNWGNLRRVPTAAERERSGGAGIYYHYDYVGGPRSYKWLGTATAPKTWQQMLLAFEHGADRLWIVNVGDLKPMEYATQFFLDLARDPGSMTLEALADYPRNWAARQFGEQHAEDIGALLTTQARFISRRKPELLAPETFSVVHYREAERVLREYRELERRAMEREARIHPEQRDAYFQLVLFPIQACANLLDLYISAGKNRLYAVQGRASANAWGDRSRELFRNDTELTRRYHELSGGKWRHMMAQTHIGYTYWQQPVANALPAVTELALGSSPKLGVAIEGSPHAWPTDDPNQPNPILPALDPLSGGTRWVDVFNRGASGLHFEATCSETWLRVIPDHGELGAGLEAERRLEISVDFAAVPPGVHLGRVSVAGPAAQCVEVLVPVWQPESSAGAFALTGAADAARCAFVETGRRIQGHRPASADPTGQVSWGRLGGGYVSIEAEHFSRALGDAEVFWRVIPHYGRTLSGVAPFPTSVAPRTLRADSPRLEYRVVLTSHGPFEVTFYVSPSLDVHPGRGLTCAASFDADEPVVLDVLGRGQPDAWARSVEDGVRKLSFRGVLQVPGEHVLAFWMIDPGIVLEKIVIDMGGLCPSYLGPPESPACAAPSRHASLEAKSTRADR